MGSRGQHLHLLSACNGLLPRPAHLGRAKIVHTSFLLGFRQPSPNVGGQCFPNSLPWNPSSQVSSGTWTSPSRLQLPSGPLGRCSPVGVDFHIRSSLSPPTHHFGLNVSKAGQTMAHLKSCREARGPIRSSAKDPTPPPSNRGLGMTSAEGKGVRPSRGPGDRWDCWRQGPPEEGQGQVRARDHTGT